jgi:hypothetical protein
MLKKIFYAASALALVGTVVYFTTGITPSQAYKMLKGESEDEINERKKKFSDLL